MIIQFVLLCNKSNVKKIQKNNKKVLSKIKSIQKIKFSLITKSINFQFPFKDITFSKRTRIFD